jgi:hypothetical protein
MAAAWIGFAGGIAAVVVSALVAVRQSRMDERLAHVNHQLDVELARATALVDRDLRAEEVLTRYRQPLAAAAFDLQSRLYNILRLGFLDDFGEDHPRAEEAMRTTLFRIAQYFGWSEILRRDIQYLSFAEDDESRRVAGLQSEIAKRFLTDRHGPTLMIWADEQRAIGERMIVEEFGKVICMGYATFDEQCHTTFGSWLARVETELAASAAQQRLSEIQHLLCELVELLDPAHIRYAAADLGRV